MGKGSESGWVKLFSVLSRSTVSVWLFATPWTIACRLLCPWDFPGRNTGVGCHFLLQGLFLTQASSPHLLGWQADSLPPSTTWLEKKYLSVMTPGVWGCVLGCKGTEGERSSLDPHMCCMKRGPGRRCMAQVPYLMQLHLLLWVHHKRIPGTVAWLVSGSENSSTEASSSL